MKLPEAIQGVYPTAPTPFHDDGRSDVGSIDRLTDFYLRIGATGVTAHGQLGEAPKLEHAEGPEVVTRMVRRPPAAAALRAATGHWARGPQIPADASRAAVVGGPARLSLPPGGRHPQCEGRSVGAREL